MGGLGCFSNHLDDAQKWLEKAIALKPGEVDPKVMLAEAFYRRDDFQKAVAALNGVDVSNNKLVIEQYPTLNVAMFESFKGQTPYELHGNGTITRLKFVRTEPLPVVNVRVNGGKEVTFFIDTGGSEVTLDTEFAKELACLNSLRYKAPFPAGSTPRFSLAGLSHSQSAIGQSKICLWQCFLCANFPKDWA